MIKNISDAIRTVNWKAHDYLYTEDVLRDYIKRGRIDVTDPINAKIIDETALEAGVKTNAMDACYETCGVILYGCDTEPCDAYTTEECMTCPHLQIINLKTETPVQIIDGEKNIEDICDELHERADSLFALKSLACERACLTGDGVVKAYVSIHDKVYKILDINGYYPHTPAKENDVLPEERFIRPVEHISAIHPVCKWELEQAIDYIRDYLG